MKKYAIIPIFIPHSGCPHDCVFCNQKKITAREQQPSENDVIEIIERNLKTIERAGIANIEIGFFGGSFTGLSVDEQNRYLVIANDYKKNGRIHGIRLSTRPDYIDKDILNNLKNNSVDLIELGVQSFDDDVLRLSERGHDSEQVTESAELIQKHGFDLGIQLMIGLPGDTPQKSFESAKKLVELKPRVARLYPTVILKDTKLMNMYKDNSYKPFSREEMLETATDMYVTINSHGINVIRIGLKSTDLINPGSNNLIGDYHPAFSEMVQGNAFYRVMVKMIDDRLSRVNTTHDTEMIFNFHCNSKDISKLVGHNRHNKEMLRKKYPFLNFKFISSEYCDSGSVDLTIE